MICFRDTAGVTSWLNTCTVSFHTPLGAFHKWSIFACPILLIRSNFVDFDFFRDFCASTMGEWLGGFFWVCFYDCKDSQSVLIWPFFWVLSAVSVSDFLSSLICSLQLLWKSRLDTYFKPSRVGSRYWNALWCFCWIYKHRLELWRLCCSRDETHCSCLNGAVTTFLSISSLWPNCGAFTSYLWLTLSTHAAEECV